MNGRLYMLDKKFKYKLPQPKLIDMTKEKVGHVKITTPLHKFAPDTPENGQHPQKAPIFGSIASIDDKIVSDLSFGLPFFRFKRGQKPHLKFTNDTGYSFDLHWHGLNITADLDGASGQVEFGTDTKIGTEIDMNFPIINNNSTLLWVHAHPMFRAASLTYTGVYGLLDIVDDASKDIQKEFEYGDNHLMLIYQDLDFNSDGQMTSVNLYQGSSSCFGLINGLSCINWYNSDQVKYVINGLYHTSNKNLVKVDLLNGTNAFRYIYVGLCDKNDNIKPFYIIQTDDGLRNPSPLKMLAIAPGSRVSIMADLNDFEKGHAYVFLYNFDLTEIDQVSLVANQLVAPGPDFNQSSNPTPSPTPIPSTTGETFLTYPEVSTIPYVTQILKNGSLSQPKNFTIKKFLKIKWSKDHRNHKSKLDSAIKTIRKIVFGEKNYSLFKNILNIDNFEYDNKLGVNYLSLLNDNYYYNLPNVNNAPTRNFILFGDTTENSNVPGGNPYGSTELIEGTPRIVVDLWNSNELDLQYALTQYNQSPNDYRPNVLPTCLFTIYPTDNKYINYSMLANDTLTLQIFDKKISYGDTTAIPLTTATIKYPTTTTPINIDQWKTLVNNKFQSTNIKIGNQNVPISSLLSYNWTFYPFQVKNLSQQVVYIKSLMVNTNNKSPYYVRLLGKWCLLQFFGKPLAADMMPMSMPMPMPCDSCHCGPNCKCTETKKCSAKCTCWKSKNTCKCGDQCKCTPTNKCSPNCSCGTKGVSKCCEKPNSEMIKMKKSACCQSKNMSTSMSMSMPMPMPKFKNNYNMNIQQIYPQYATTDPNNPIMTFDDNSELIIPPNSQYYGPIDGFQSDVLMNFSVKVDSSEQWIYHNLGLGDTHPFHFHLTSGYVDVSNQNQNQNKNNQALVSLQNDSNPLIYSKDVYGIGSQQILSFYLKFANHTSKQSSLNPKIPYLGYMYHCHYMAHHDMNMMGEYFVYNNREDHFGSN